MESGLITDNNSHCTAGYSLPILSGKVFSLVLLVASAWVEAGMAVTVHQMTLKESKRVVPLMGAMERKTFPKHESLAANFEREVRCLSPA